MPRKLTGFLRGGCKTWFGWSLGSSHAHSHTFNTHTHTHTQTHSHKQTHTHTHTHTQTHTLTHTYTHTHTHTHPHAHMHYHTHTHSYTYTDTNTHTHVYKHLKREHIFMRTCDSLSQLRVVFAAAIFGRMQLNYVLCHSGTSVATSGPSVLVPALFCAKLRFQMGFSFPVCIWGDQN